jgi:hypothetical protein
MKSTLTPLFILLSFTLASAQCMVTPGQITLNVSSKGLFMLVLKTENHTVNYKITVIE